MNIEKQDLSAAAQAGIISQTQADQLWQHWQARQIKQPMFCFSHLLYYFGGMLAIAAVTVFVTMAWERWAGLPLVSLSIVLFFSGLWLSRFFMNKALAIPAGIMVTFSLAVVPLAVYHLQVALGYGFDQYHYQDYHRFIDWRWVSMEMATLLVGVILLYLYRFPFIMFLVAMTLWYLSMDMWPLLVNAQQYTFYDRSVFSACFGLFILAIALYADFKRSPEEDYAYWLYMVGVIVFWGGLSCLPSKNEWSNFLYFIINLAMMMISIILSRRVFLVFGALGVFGYFSHLAFSLFKGSLIFPLVLVAIGIMIIFAGTRWSSFRGKLENVFEPYLSERITKRW